jgi:hypothetical protein
MGRGSTGKRKPRAEVSHPFRDKAAERMGHPHFGVTQRVGHPPVCIIVVSPLNSIRSSAYLAPICTEDEKVQFRVFSVQGMSLGVVWVEGQ